MRKSPLAICISASFAPGAQLAASRYGPVSPYTSQLNQKLYYRMIGQSVQLGHAMGKTRSFEKNLLWAWRYQAKKELEHDRQYQILLQQTEGRTRI